MEETRDNSDVLAMRTGSFKGGYHESPNKAPLEDDSKELLERIHLLTEENHVLFEQITLLRSHYDKFNEEVANKQQEASYKISAFDALQNEFAQL